MPYATFYKIKPSQVLYHDYLLKKYCGVSGFKCRENNYYVTSSSFRSTAVMLSFLKEFEEYKQANAIEAIAYMLKALLNK